MADESELDRLDPEPVICKLSTGFAVEVVRLKTRQFFRLLRVLTHGAGPALMQAGLDFGADAADFASRFVMLVVMSIPDAESEAIMFLQSMAKPAGLCDKPKLSRQEKADNDKAWEDFNAELHNPALDDTIELIEVIVRQEAPELQALGKRLDAMLKMFRATGQDKEEATPDPTPEELASQAPSPSPSTSSPASTDGATRSSSTSRSAASGRSSKQRQPAASASS